MDRDLALRYLKHLSGIIDAQLALDDLSVEHLSSVERELAAFRSAAVGSKAFGPAAHELIGKLTVSETAKRMPSLKLTWWTYVLAPLSLRSMNRARQAELRAHLRAELERIQSDVRALHYAAQF
jgi:hypothetical protein